MKSKLLILIFLFITHIVSSQENNFKESEIDIPTKTQIIYGTLLTPNSVKKPPLVILIPGSGPTDRDGNNAVMKNNSLKYLAESLSNQKIATYRFDKSVLTFTKKDTLKIKALTFNTFINEATSVIKYFKKFKNYSKIIIAGHSQGSLVGMVASKNNADAFISLEGAGRPIDEIIIEQIAKQAPYLKEETIRVLKELKQGKLVTDFNPMLISLFNQQVQPFLISWIQYNPQIEIKKLTIPILIIQGTKDIQVNIKDAELLHKANTTSKLKLIENMNHIFKEINGDVNENLQSYSNPKLPITPILTTTILNFINQLK
ncbi:MAG: alpha/beta hydrolase [Lutibacter sp.]|uniref:alpha/beta hydrolase n=1 Tax=Lutibacter sp. TaxID=1925666 RepID=UPI00299D0268|nr:alpha/beta hydrolase [Lutibacter sp.]MDX1829927.1 alpha/beta hydrolase [Lutibacter sp.]